MLVKLSVVGLITISICWASTERENVLTNVNSNRPSRATEQTCSFGVCVHHLLCVDGEQMDFGASFMNPRVDVSRDKECPDTFEVCCRPDQIDKNTTRGAIIQPPTQTTQCGNRNEEGVGFKMIGNTDEAEFGEFPWVVAMMEAFDLDGTVYKVFTCGGSLIHPSVVLTAAHCVQGKTVADIRARLGEWDTQTDKEPFKYFEAEAESVVIHELYYDKALLNDIALVFLTQPVKLSGHINTVCLPPQGETFDRTRCFANGWGQDKFGKEGKYPVILKKVELPVVPRLKCRDNIRAAKSSPKFTLHESFMCAGGEGKDMCKGDGGGPLVCPIEGSPNFYHQVGITSWGVGCGTVGVPGVYVNVAMFRDWIDQQLKVKGLSV